MKLKRTEVPYTELLLTYEGLQPDHETLKAIMEMLRSKDIKGVQQFIGMANNFSRFCSQLLEAYDPLRPLTYNDAP